MNVEASLTEPLSVVKISPELVGRHDKAAWLELFTPDALIEDPVGADRYVGRERHGPFWDAFIAPNRVTFRPRRDFASGSVVVRYVTISTITPVSDAPFELPAIIEYRVHDGRLASLRAFWEPRRAVMWHLGQGVRGVAGLTKHGVRMMGGLGPGAALGFSRALMPRVSRAGGAALAARFASAIGGSREAWLSLVGDADVTVARPEGGDVRGATDAWEVLARSSPLEPEEVIVAGDHLACVLADRERAAALIARVARGRITALRMLWETR